MLGVVMLFIACCLAQCRCVLCCIVLVYASKQASVALLSLDVCCVALYWFMQVRRSLPFCTVHNASSCTLGVIAIVTFLAQLGFVLFCVILLVYASNK